MLTQAKFQEIKASGSLPSPSGIATKVIDLTNEDDVTSQKVAQVIKVDPALSGLLIKVSNSRVAYQTRPIASIVDAVSVLGFGSVRQLVLGLSLIEGNRNGACTGFDYGNFWASSLLTAITAQNLLLEGGIGAPEEIFTLGLLGQIGRLALATAYARDYSNILKHAMVNEEGGLARLELAKFEFDHNQLSQAMLADWSMPQVFQQIVLHHENPTLSDLAEGSRGWHLLNNLHIANYFSSLCMAPEQLRRKMIPKLILIATRRGVELNALAALVEKSVAQWHEWCQLCEIPVPEIPDFSELFKATPLTPGMLDAEDDLSVMAGTFYKLRILLVDDDRAASLIVKKLLENAGHTVATAGDGIEALSLVSIFKPQLIITDWEMPRMGGIQFCRTLRKNTPWRNIYVFIMTSQDGMDKLVEAFEAGVNDYITKPILPRTLLARLRAGQRVVQLQDEMENDRKELRKFADELASINNRLRKSDISMRAILNNSPYMAWLKDADGRYLQANKTYIEHLKLADEQQIIGKTDFDIWPQETAQKYLEDEQAVMQSLQPRRIEESSRSAGRTRWMETIKTPVVDEAQVVLGTTGFARDITDQINQEAQRLDEVRVQRDALVREVNHRIKNSLQGIFGLLQQHIVQHPELKETIRIIAGRINSIAIIHGLQAQGASEEIDIDKLVSNIIQSSDQQANYKNELSQQVFLGSAESVPLALVINELYTNACKHRIANSAPAIRLKSEGDDTVVTIANRFEERSEQPATNGQGQNLIKLLLPQKYTALKVEKKGGIYSVELRLSPPVTIVKK